MGGRQEYAKARTCAAVPQEDVLVNASRDEVSAYRAQRKPRLARHAGGVQARCAARSQAGTVREPRTSSDVVGVLAESPHALTRAHLVAVGCAKLGLGMAPR